MRHRFGKGRGGHFLETLVLLLIAEQPSHGYEIAKKLSELGFDFGNIAVMGNLYRLLSRLEMQGLVRSQWDLCDPGPARRVYKITEAGKEFLEFCAERLKFQKHMLEEFFKRYEKLSDQRRK